MSFIRPYANLNRVGSPGQQRKSPTNIGECGAGYGEHEGCSPFSSSADQDKSTVQDERADKDEYTVQGRVHGQGRATEQDERMDQDHRTEPDDRPDPAEPRQALGASKRNVGRSNRFRSQNAD